RLGESDDDDEIQELRQPLLRQSSSLVGRPRKGAAGAGSKRRHGAGASNLSSLAQFVEWWFSKPPMQPRPSAQLPTGEQPGRIEPKTFFANERTFLSWLNMAVTIGSISAALLGFSGSSKADPGLSACRMHLGCVARGMDGAAWAGRNMIEFIACILLPVAILMCGYALLVFIWRGGQIKDKAATLYDDRRGPLGLAGIIVAALSLIFLVAFADLIHLLRHHGDAPTPAPGPASALAGGVEQAVNAAARSLLGARAS
ncbi:hypothetical protein ABPG77_009886, partial [Micractinium sp. CCAP 211/92]